MLFVDPPDGSQEQAFSVIDADGLCRHSATQSLLLTVQLAGEGKGT